MFFYKNLVTIAKVSWEKSKLSSRYLNFLSREEDIHIHSSFIYGRSVKRRKTINEMGGHIPGGNFPEESFPGGVWWVGIFRMGIFSGWIFLEPYIFFIEKNVFFANLHGNIKLQVFPVLHGNIKFRRATRAGGGLPYPFLKSKKVSWFCKKRPWLYLSLG